MIFQRKIYDALLEWKRLSHGTTAIMLEGARRVGKSTIAEAFAKNEYDDYLLLDFGKESREIRQNFEENIGDPDVFFRNLFLLKSKTRMPDRSLIIFDEVQRFPLARQAIKYLVADGRYDYIETGSLISIKRNVKDIIIPSEEQKLKMYPMDFEEFLWARGDHTTAEEIRNAFSERRPLGDSIHRKIMRTFREYMAVGGMPQAVARFCDGGTYEEIDYVKRTILDLYEDDLRKSEEGGSDKAVAIFRALPANLSSHNRQFKLASVDKNARFGNYLGDIQFIDSAMIGNLCRNVSKPEVTLDLYAEPDTFKLYLCDTGLLLTQVMRAAQTAGDDLYKALLFGNLGVDQGMIIENMIAQMLACNGHGLFFHTFRYQPAGSAKEKTYEVDFLLVRGKRLCPLEVKSSGYHSHKSFDFFKEKYRQLKLPERFILYTKDLKQEDGILYLPLYMAMCL